MCFSSSLCILCFQRITILRTYFTMHLFLCVFSAMTFVRKAGQMRLSDKKKHEQFTLGV